MPYLKDTQLCLKINCHSTKFVFMYRKHNSGKNLQHKYMHKIFWNYVSSRWHSKYLVSNGQYVAQNRQNVHKFVQKVHKQPVVVLSTQ